jgi:hypothetical protein
MPRDPDEDEEDEDEKEEDRFRPVRAQIATARRRTLHIMVRVVRQGKEITTGTWTTRPASGRSAFSPRWTGPRRIGFAHLPDDVVVDQREDFRPARGFGDMRVNVDEEIIFVAFGLPRRVRENISTQISRGKAPQACANVC